MDRKVPQGLHRGFLMGEVHYCHLLLAVVHCSRALED